MYESTQATAAGSPADPRALDLTAVAEVVRAARPDGCGAGVLVDRIAAAERLKAALSALQARDGSALTLLRVAQDAAGGVPVRDRGRSAAAELGLARRESPSRGAHHLRLAQALTTDLPHTLRRLADGDISEWRATLIEREAHCLGPDDRRRLDAELCSDRRRLHGCGDRRVAGMARAVAARLDAAAVVARARRAEADRRVWIRPAPDTMAYLTALVPVAQGVACYAALKRAADTTFDRRGHGQVMADVLVERLTGISPAGSIPAGSSRPPERGPNAAERPPGPPAVPIAVQLVISDEALLGAGNQAAVVAGYGPIPAAVARRLVADANGRAGDGRTGCGAGRDSPTVTLRRLYARPDTGQLVALESRQRCFPRGLADFIDLRDGGSCRTPFCDAPIRHHDHGLARSRGGPTAAANGLGLCERCNYNKESPGWQTLVAEGRTGEHANVVITPTGRRYRGTAPPILIALAGEPGDPQHVAAPSSREPGPPARGRPSTAAG